jgi:HAE1 family hydrophobic/amphiphilic exporter-1
MSLVRKSAEHPISVLMVYAAVLTFGLVSFRQLNRELLPVLPIPAARVITEYRGVPAPEIEDLITVPVENSLSSVKAVRSMRSMSKDELSAVQLVFDWGIDRQRAAVEIREKIDALYPFLPHGAAKPLVFATEDRSQRPLLTLAVVAAPGRHLQEISYIVRNELTARLKQVPGVAGLRIVGLAESEIRIDVDGSRLAAAGLPLQYVAGVLASSLYDGPLGTVIEGRREYLVEATTGIYTLDQIRRIPVATAENAMIPLGQFARVHWDLKETTSYFHHNGREAIGIFVEKLPGSGSLNTARRIQRFLGVLRPLYAEDFEVQIVDDPTREIARGIRNLLLAIALGCAAVFMVLLLLFQRPAVPLIVSASIPVSLMGVFVFMKFAAIGLNLISLSGLAIGIGMIVDNSIVIVDSLIERRAMRAEEIASAAAGTTKAIVGSTLSTLLVFLPVVFIRGVTGALFRELALTVSCLLLVSLLCALTLTPALYSLMAPKLCIRQRNPTVFSMPRLLYSRYLERELRRPLAAPALLVLLALAGVFAAVALPKRILPATETGELDVQVDFTASMPLALSRSTSEQVAAGLLEIDGVESVFASAGYDRESLIDRGDPERDPRRVHFQVTLATEAVGSAGSIEAEIAKVLEGFPDICYGIDRPANTIRLLLGETEVVEYRLSGAPREFLVAAAQSIAAQLEARQLITEARIDTRKEVSRVAFDLDLASIAAQKAEPTAVLETLRTAVRGSVEAQLPSGGERIDIRVRLDPAQTDTEARIKKIRVPAGGGIAEAGVFGAFRQSFSYPQLHRVDRSPAVSLTAHPARGARNEVLAYLAAHRGYRGEILSVSALKRNQRHILMVFGFALLLMYMLIGAQFESFVVPFVLLLSLLPALSGSLIVLLLCGYSLNINSFLGILMLVGTAINMSIILAVALQPTIDRGGLVRACASRLRPVAATVLSTTVALIPIAVSRSGEAALQSHTAVALLGGLSIGMVMVLLVFPVMYDRSVGPGAVK